MLSRGGLLLLVCLLWLPGCASMEEPRLSMLGDTGTAAYFIDRQNVKRLPNGNYQFPVRVNLYQKGQPHHTDDSRETNQVLFIELDCHAHNWTETGRGVMDPEGKILFRLLSPSTSSQAIEPDTIYAVAYNYLCRNEAIVAVHNHP